jgi:hypothetical protein
MHDMLIARTHLNIYIYVRSNVWVAWMMSEFILAAVVVFGSVGDTRS